MALGEGTAPQAAGLRALRIEGLPVVGNVARVVPGLYRGGAPSPKGVASLSGLGVKTIINLRHFYRRSEGDGAANAGIRYIWCQSQALVSPSPTHGRHLSDSRPGDAKRDHAL